MIAVNVLSILMSSIKWIFDCIVFNDYIENIASILKYDSFLQDAYFEAVKASCKIEAIKKATHKEWL